MLRIAYVCIWLCGCCGRWWKGGCKVIEDRTNALELLLSMRLVKLCYDSLASVATTKSSKDYIKIKCLIKKFKTFISPNSPSSASDTDFCLSSLVHQPPCSFPRPWTHSHKNDHHPQLPRPNSHWRCPSTPSLRFPSPFWPFSYHDHNCCHKVFCISQMPVRVLIKGLLKQS